MERHLTASILKQRPFVLLVAMLLAALGGWAWRELPIDAFPEVTNVQVMILTEAEGKAPVDVERQVTYPIELAMSGLPRVRLVRSLSKAGLSQVVVIFDDDVDVYFARQLVFERLEGVREDLPPGAEPAMGPVSSGLGEIFQYSLEGEGRSLEELRTLQDWLVAPRLRALRDINEVNSFGGHVRQFQVRVDPDRLRGFGITLRDVVEAVEAANADVGGGWIVKGWERVTIRTAGLVRSLEDLRDVVVAAKDGTPVYLHQVAEIVLGHEPRSGAVTRDGKGEAVCGMAIMLFGANSKVVVDRVKAAVPEIQKALPPGVTIRPFYDRTDLIQACVETVSQALMAGGVLVVLVLLVFLGSFRAALITAFSLPLTALFTFGLMKIAGLTANLMSLGGLAVAIGMIVDGSIVVAENMIAHLERHPENRLSLAAATEALVEVARPVTFAILIVIVVFLPVLALEEVEGKMFRPLALTLGLAMLASLVAALTVVPVLCADLLRRRSPSAEEGSEGRLHRLYLWFLRKALRRRRLTLLCTLALLLGALSLVPDLGLEFLPPLDEGAIAVNVVRLPSASLEGSVHLATILEREILTIPEVRTVVSKSGRAEISEDPMGPEQTDVFVMLHPRKDWAAGREKADVLRDVRAVFDRVPGLNASFSQPIALRVNELISGIRSQLAVKIFGDDLDELRILADRVAGEVGRVRGARDVKVEQVSGYWQLEIRPDRRAIARYGIEMADVNELVETAIGGRRVGTIVDGEKRFALVVRYRPEARDDAEAIGRLLVRGATGQQVPLAEIARITEVEAPAQISREDGHRRIVVECNVEGRDTGSFVTEVQERLRDIEGALRPGWFITYGGTFEGQQRAMARLSILVPLSVLLIALMLFAAFGSLRSTLLVLVNLPFALIGGILFLWSQNLPLSVSAAIGFVALFGTSVEDGTVLVSFIDRRRASGESPLHAVYAACSARARPVLTTSLTTLLGLIPMIMATGPGAEIQRPLAGVVLGGLSSALLLVLVVLPVLYVMSDPEAPGELPEA